MKKYKSLFFLGYLLLVGCYKNYLYVQQRWIDRNDLASTWIGSPDPKQKDPPKGQQLIVSWNLPSRIYVQKPHLEVTIRFWDHSEAHLIRKVPKRRGWEVFSFEKNLQEPKGKILSYQVKIVGSQGEEMDLWQHQLWTKSVLLEEK